MSNDRKMTAFFIHEAAKHKAHFLIAFALVVPVAVLSAYAPKLFQLAIDEGMVPRNADAFLQHGIAFAVLLIASLALDPIQQIILMTGGVRTLREVRASIVEHIAHLGRDAFEKSPLGVFVSRATSDVEAIGETLASGIVGIFTDVARIIVVLIILTAHDVQLGLLTFLFVPLVGGIINWFRLRIRVLHVKARTLTARLAGVLNETVSMRREVLNFHLQETTGAHFDEMNEELYNANIKTVSYDSATYSVIDGISHVAVGIVFVLVARSVFLDDVMSVGEVAMYIMYLQQLFTPFKALGQRFTMLQAAYAALQKIGDTLELPRPQDLGTETAARGILSVQDLHFSYDGRRDVLSGVSFELRPSSSLAIVGPTGSGKTTIIRLLTRQYEPRAGTLLLGGEPLRSYTRRSLKQCIVLIPQEPVLVRGTVWENVALVRPEMTRDQIAATFIRMGADTIMAMLPQGYDTPLTSGGTNISAGQRQLIALARAFVVDAPILIFDESTANIDTQTEVAIQNALKLAMEERCTIVIAHRLSTIREVEHILVLKDGTVAEEGRHLELMQQNGIYRRMYDLQAFEESEQPA